MKIVSKIKEKIKKISFLLIFLWVFLSPSNSQILYSLSMDNYQSGIVIEELRLKVPSIYRDIWLDAEKNIWDPWLSDQDGFLGRNIFWDKDREEALILVNWKNKELWKSISSNEVNEIQIGFENYVKRVLNLDVNPFQLIYEGELYKQG
ncbi:TIGR03792 family protein [Prochlorococcus marinus XMU1411]|uniref:TIGR03792 family protein n=1 Tax=Prochlorococcus marinus TaxID=1219 RepID=UPI001ADB9F4C|nr:TIGR03792 family protein [Prochlorococcus marinus]MBO8244267.1 TIGR03792 family protein [Prochlorococcus marinus XMU1411]MBW3055352.1 TIGR03792 family protein [Prochlorococcus marinus str. MU1411]MCR8537095.1 TIGR03792 family protein [Prochlorococcus marinus CUG1430]